MTEEDKLGINKFFMGNPQTNSQGFVRCNAEVARLIAEFFYSKEEYYY